MQVQPDDFRVLATVARYYVLTREQIQQICFPQQASGRATRKRLLRLRNAGYLTRHSVPVALPDQNGAAPVYYATKPGAEALASYFDDERHLATNTRTPRGDRLAHWIGINCTRQIIEAAVASQEDVTLDGWFTEWEVINKGAVEKDQFVLHTQLSDNPPLSCSPDAAFALSTRGFTKVFYLEQDQGTSSPKQIAARKSKGYAALAERQHHRVHFPHANIDSFSVLLVTTSRYRCLEFGKQMQSRDRCDLWRMLNQKALTAETFLHGDIVYDSEGQPGPLIKPAPRDPTTPG